MSGGQYGRGKAPERACLKVELWPAEDRAMWRRALQPADPFEPEGGERAGHSAASNRKAEKGYGRWLTWLASVGGLEQPGEPAARITPERVKAYVAHLTDLGNGSQTVLGRLQELGEMARVFAPTADWSFLSRIASRQRAVAKPVRDKRSKLVVSDELVALGLRLMEMAAEETTPRLAALAYRDGLIIALLALRPLRRRNLAGLRLGATLVPHADGWRIAFPGPETKTGEPLEAPWPAALVEPLQRYLAVYRPILAQQRSRWASPIGDALWASSHGSPMTEMALYDQIRQRTQDGLGKAINPHLFRDAAATTLAIADPAHVRLASRILGHRSMATTERYYQQAQSLEAHRMYADIVGEIGPRLPQPAAEV